MIMTPKDMVKAIRSFTLEEVMEMVEEIKKTFNISDMTLSTAAPAASSTAAAPTVEEKTEFSVVLTAFGEGKKIGVIKIIRTITGASLGDAKKIVEDLASGPFEVKAGVPKAEADELKKQIEAAGGTVEVK
jgi:large subunit ribosomal protein L7/L12